MKTLFIVWDRGDLLNWDLSAILKLDFANLDKIFINVYYVKECPSMKPSLDIQEDLTDLDKLDPTKIVFILIKKDLENLLNKGVPESVLSNFKVIQSTEAYEYAGYNFMYQTGLNHWNSDLINVVLGQTDKYLEHLCFNLFLAGKRGKAIYMAPLHSKLAITISKIMNHTMIFGYNMRHRVPIKYIELKEESATYSI